MFQKRSKLLQKKKIWKQFINYKGHGWMTKKYFDDRISPSLTKVCKWAIDKITRFDPYSGIIQNQSESMNKLLKSLNKLKEAPVDVVNLSFVLCQGDI